MVIRKQVVVFLILQNMVSTFCEPLPVIFSGDSEYMTNDKLLDFSREYDDDDLTIIVKPEMSSTKNIFYDSVEGESNYHDYSNEYYPNEYYPNEYYPNEFYSNEYIDNNIRDYVDKKSKNFCPGEDYSMISHSDIKYLIEEKAEILKIKEKVLNSYYPDAEEIFKKHVGELEEFQERFKERPGHMLHILRSMTSLREKLEPDVEEFAAQLDQFEALEDSFNGAAKGAVVMLNQLEKYKKICHINCEEIDFRFGDEIITGPSIVEKTNGMYCIRLKHLNDYINEKLSEVEAQYDNGLSQPLDIRDKMYEQKILELKSNLKDAAVKQFGMTMYDILSLHDDYYHFRTDLKHVNVSSEIYNIMENNAEIGFKLIGLKRDLEEYRQYCMRCGSVRIKRQAEDPPAGPDDEDTETHGLSVDAAVDELIQSKVDEIKKSIESNFITMFAGLDEKLNDPDVIDHYVSDLHPIQIVIDDDIKMEQEALLRLRNRIPEASINKILVLSKESKQMVQNLESAKQFINDAISTDLNV